MSVFMSSRRQKNDTQINTEIIGEGEGQPQNSLMKLTKVHQGRMESLLYLLSLHLHLSAVSDPVSAAVVGITVRSFLPSAEKDEAK